MLILFRILTVAFVLIVLLGLLVPDDWLRRVGYYQPRWYILGYGLLTLLLLRLAAVWLL